MNQFDITLVTCQNLPEPDHDQAPLMHALESAGLRARVCAWDAPDVDWAQTAMTLLRSPWNYYRHFSQFLAWLDHVDDVSLLHNPIDVVRWNAHKSYLLTLPLRGVRTVSTVLVEQDQQVDLSEVCRREGFEKIVIKPAVSAGSYETHAMDADALDVAAYQRLLAAGDVLIQPYVSSVDDYGERSLIFIDGQCTHCVRKAPRFADDQESVTGPHNPSEDELALARRAVDSAGTDLLYARVDLVRDAQERPQVAELELIEPSLFFAIGPQALSRLIRGIERRLAAL